MKYSEAPKEKIIPIGYAVRSIIAHCQSQAHYRELYAKARREAEAKAASIGGGSSEPPAG